MCSAARGAGRGGARLRDSIILSWFVRTQGPASAAPVLCDRGRESRPGAFELHEFNCMDYRSNVTRTRVSRGLGRPASRPLRRSALRFDHSGQIFWVNTCLSMLLDASRPGIWNRQNRESERCRDSSCQTTCLASSPAAASNFTFTGHFEKIRVRPRLRLNFSGVLGSDWLFGVPLRPVSLARNCLAYATERNPACI